MKLLQIALSIALILNLVDASIEDEWKSFKAKYNKSYESIEEEQKRLEVFKGNKKSFDEHNAKFERGEYAFKMGANLHADISFEEIEAKNVFVNFDTWWENIKKAFYFKIAQPQTAKINRSMDVPDELDWRHRGVVTKVKDQSLDCGSCWSFAVNAALESHHAIKTGRLISLSAQELVDCASRAYGCNGGIATTAFEYIAENGISSEVDYPYEAKQGECRDLKKSEVTMYGHARIYGDEEDLKRAVSQFGPIVVYIGARPKNMFYYSEGIYDDSECEGPSNHGVVFVGYGTDEKTGLEFWIVKNSWSKDWGEGGYMRLARNKEICGLGESFFYFPIIDDNGLNEYDSNALVTLSVIFAIIMVFCCCFFCCRCMCKRCCCKRNDV